MIHYSLAEVMRGGFPQPVPALKSVPERAEPPFAEQLATQNSAAGRQEPAASTPADVLGLIATPGAKATISGQTFFGTETGWSITSPEQTAEAIPAGARLLGFLPEWVPEVTAAMVNNDNQPAGVVRFNSKLYATETTARHLAKVLGGTAVIAAEAHPGTGASADQWEIEFGGGRLLNAGLVADMFMRDPARAAERLRAEIG